MRTAHPDHSASFRAPAGAWLLALAWLLPGAGMATPVQTNHAEVALHSYTTHAIPGESHWVGLRLRPDEGWHTYWKNPGDSGLPTQIHWTLPDGVDASDIQWPHPGRYGLDDFVNYGYGRQTVHLVELRLAENWPAGEDVVARAQAEWLICSDICVPESAELELRIPTSRATAEVDPIWRQDFDDAFARLPQAAATPARMAREGDTVVWQWPQPELDRSARYAVFPEHPELLDHSAAQHLWAGDGGLFLEQRIHPYFEAMPSESAWVVVARDDKGDTRAWRILAAPGTVEVRSDDAVAIALHEAPPGATGGSAPIPAGSASIWLILAAAMTGGLLLNLMPCVFPVLALKALGVLHAQGTTRAIQRRHALAYTAGVVLSCLAVAGALLALRAAGAALGWGFQLQSPVFIGTLALLFFAFGLSLHGVFSLGTRIMGIGEGLTQRQGLGGSFNTGILAVVVASPCTAPFMGVALGYAITQPAALALTIFAALGFGLALPFLLVGFVPQLARWLPRPGPWMERFKHAMAFPMYLSVAWLLWVLSRQAGSEALLAVLVAMVLVALAATLWHAGSRPARVMRWAAVAGSIVLLASPVVRDGTPPPAGAAEDMSYEMWSPQRVEELRSRGDTVFVNFTADWCITCLANERAVLSARRIRELFGAPDVHYLVADWTRADPAITQALAEHGRNGVPLYLVYRPGEQAEVLPQVLTVDRVRTALAGAP